MPGTVSKIPESLPLRPKDQVPCLELTNAESEQLRRLAEDALDTKTELPLDQRLDDLVLLAHEAPQRVRATLTAFRLTGRPYGGLVVSNLPIDEAAAGPTPTSYSGVPESREAERASVLLLLLGSLLGDPVSYLTQQRGKMVIDIFPVAGHEGQQLGSSSTTALEWHNEDAFHPLRADWIMLLGLRNHDQVPTTLAPINAVPLDPEVRRVLSEDRYLILPDESHTAGFNASTTGIDEGEWVRQGFQKIAEMNEAPKYAPVLTGAPEAPFIRIDPAFMPRDLEPEALAALDALITGINTELRDVVLAPGDLLVIDNKRAVHGRKSFTARYDGTDRWLRRINVMADLRRAEGRRYSPHGRALV